MTRNTLIAVVLAVAALSGCDAAAGPTVTVTASGSAAPATPIAQAAAVLARTGAVPTGAVYWSNDEPDTAVCAGGAAEADGTLPASNDDRQGRRPVSRLTTARAVWGAPPIVRLPQAWSTPSPARQAARSTPDSGMGEDEDRGFTVRDTRASTRMEQNANSDVPEPEVAVEAPPPVQVRRQPAWGQYPMRDGTWWPAASPVPDIPDRDAPPAHSWGQYPKTYELRATQHLSRRDIPHTRSRLATPQEPPEPARPPGAPGERHPRKIPQDVIIAVSVRDQGRCVSCGATKDLHFDHKIPWSRGGTNSENNIQLMCGSCNRRKGAVDISDEARG